MPFSKIGIGILRTLSLIENFMKHINFLKISSKPLYRTLLPILQHISKNRRDTRKVCFLVQGYKESKNNEKPFRSILINKTYIRDNKV
jgi:hypothetical protein